MTARGSWLAGLSVALLLAGAPALAQTEGPARVQAEALFAEADRLMVAGQFAEACPKLERVARELTPGKVGATLALAECYEGSGRPFDAWTEYGIAVQLAIAASDDRRGPAEGKRATLEKTLPHIGLRLARETAALPGLSVALDGAGLSPSAIAQPLVCAPGVHRLRVEAPGRRTWETSVEAPMGANVLVDVPPLALPGPAPGPGGGAGAAPLSPRDARGTPVTASHLLSNVDLGAFVATAVVASALSLHTLSRASDAASTCGDKPSDREGCLQSEVAQIDGESRAVTALWIGAGAFAAAWPVLRFVVEKEAPAGPEVSLAVMPGGAHLDLRF